MDCNCAYVLERQQQYPDMALRDLSGPGLDLFWGAMAFTRRL